MGILLSTVSTILEMLPCISAGELEGRVGSYKLRTPRFIFLDGSVDGVVM